MNEKDLITFLSSAARFPSDFCKQRNQLFPKQNLREAAVLIGIIPNGSQWQIMLTRRAETLRRHTGQIALAGGKRDPSDLSLTATALRETHEETGVAPHHWQTFPSLSTYHTPSGYSVTPIPALCNIVPSVQANSDEVAEIFYLPLDFAFNLSHYTFRPLNHNGHVLQAPVLPYQHYDIWGLTAMILYDFATQHRRFCEQIK